MADYRLVYTNLKTGELLGEANTISVSMTDGLNAVGSLQATILLEDTHTMEAPDGAGGSEEITTPQAFNLTTFVPGATGLYLERDGVIIWGGILWTIRLSVQSSTAVLGAEGFMSYLRRVHIQEDITYSSTDQGAIAKDLLEKAMAKGGADIGLTAPTPTTSTSRDREYPAIERKSYGEAIEQLAAVNGGFVWRFEHSWNGSDDGIDTTLELDVSELGRLTSYVFVLGVNMVLLDLSLDGKAIANYTEAWGQAEPGEQTSFVRSAYNASAITSFPLLETIATFSDVKEADTLQGKADEMLSRGASALQRISLQVYADTVPVLGSYEVGDRVEVRGSYGGLSVTGTWRIISLSVSVTVEGLEDIRLSLVPEEVFNA